jgi:hypothetical protein
MLEEILIEAQIDSDIIDDVNTEYHQVWEDSIILTMYYKKRF